MLTPCGNCLSSGSSPSPTSRWDPAHDGHLRRNKCNKKQNKDLKGANGRNKGLKMDAEKKLERNPATICVFLTILDQQWCCLCGDIPEEERVRMYSCNTINHRYIRAVWNSCGTCCWGWRFDRKLLTSDAGLLIRQATEEALAVSGVYV